MCGIAGIVRWRAGTMQAELGAQVQAMVRALAHRGPDDEGVLAEQGVALGMRRLAIQDLSSAGHQPMSSDDGAVTVVFNGELYDHLDLRARLLADGQRFRGTSDTETLVHGYRRLGVDATLAATGGMYAFAALDRHRRKLVLGRDGFGIKPLYLRRGPGQLAFASEIRAFGHDGHGRPGPDPEVLDSYLEIGWIPSPRTAFAGVSRLDPGTILEVDLDTGAEETRRFYRLAPEPLDPGLGDADLFQLFRERLGRVVRRQLIADVPVGVFLSGGLDSGAILAMAAPALPAPPRTFTIGFKSGDVRDETAAAASAAAAMGAPHTVVSLDPTTLGDLGPLVEALEEPIADSAVLPLWHLCRGTALEMKVALSGEGGDEALGGYTRYFWGWAAHALSAAGAVASRMATAAPQLRPRSHGVLNLVRRASKFAGTLALSEADRYLAWFQLFSPDERRALCGAVGVRVTERITGLFQQGAAAGLDVVQRMQVVDLSAMLLDNLLVKADKLSMAHGLEVRVPLLDRQLVELGLALPVRAKIGVRGNKPYLRRALDGQLPRAITRAGKRGFEIPVQRWFRDPGTAALRDRLSSGALVRGLGFSSAAIRSVIDRHLGGEDCGRKLFALSMLEHWAALHA